MRVDDILRALKPLPPEGHGPIKDRVTEFVRERIASGALPAGACLPSTRKLAALWGLRAPTVQTGLEPLTREGLLVRTVGSGTRVRDPRKRLASVGVYEYADWSKIPVAAYGRNLNALLAERLARDDMRMRLWIDPRPRAALREPWPEVVEACRRGDVQGLLLPDGFPPGAKWFDQLGVPVVAAGVVAGANRVCHDHLSFLDLGFGELARMGCRVVAWITTLPTRSKDTERRHLSSVAFAHARDTAARLGLSLAGDCVMAPEERINPVAMSPERFGYERFGELWRRRPRPDGLLVYDDVVARGVITAVLDARVRVPNDLKIVAHRNREIDLLCPFPATFIESSATEAAEALIRQLIGLFNREPAASVVLPFRLERRQMC
ncbi:MAG: substrate-binding domain-containing protein [Kiritimatiellae bacterium]|nr:substrate-binding domain-containing protein [Kiritimatiellia bacterium]